MTADQLKELKDIRNRISDIRGNEEIVSELKSRLTDLIDQDINEVKSKLDALYEE